MAVLGFATASTRAGLIAANLRGFDLQLAVFDCVPVHNFGGSAALLQKACHDAHGFVYVLKEPPVASA